MTHGEQIDAFVNDLEAKIEHYRSEFDLPYASVVGALELVKARLVEECLGQDDSGEDSDDWRNFVDET